MSQSPAQSTLLWRKSARSSAQGSNCVEVADADPRVAVRDSKNPDGPHHTFSRREITDLARRIKQGAHDL